MSTTIILHVLYYRLQWNPSKEDTIGTKDFVLYREVSLTRGSHAPIETETRRAACESTVSTRLFCCLYGEIRLYLPILGLKALETGFTAGCG